MKWYSKLFSIMIDELLWAAAHLLAYVPDVKYYEQSLALITRVSVLERDHYEILERKPKTEDRFHVSYLKVTLFC